MISIASMLGLRIYRWTRLSSPSSVNSPRNYSWHHVTPHFDYLDIQRVAANPGTRRCRQYTARNKRYIEVSVSLTGFRDPSGIKGDYIDGVSAYTYFARIREARIREDESPFRPLIPGISQAIYILIMALDSMRQVHEQRWAYLATLLIQPSGTLHAPFSLPRYLMTGAIH